MKKNYPICSGSGSTPGGLLKHLLFSLLVLLCQQTYAVNYYVSPDGSDSNNGTSSSSPFRTLQHAHNQTNPGDVVYVMNGTHQVARGHILLVTRAGTSTDPITYKAYPGHQPVLYVPKNTACWAAIRVEASHIVIDGLTLKGDNENITLEEGWAVHDYYKSTTTRDWDYVATTNTNGIYIIGNKSAHVGPVNVAVKNCLIYNFPGGGIAAEVSDYITIENNRVHSNAWYMIWAGSGISFFHPFNSDNNTATYKNIVRYNYAYDNETKIPWADQNRFSDGNGIIIDDTRNTQINQEPYTGKTLVENNLTYNNGGMGINVYSSENTDVVNNTVYNNNRSPHLNYPNLSTGSSNNCRVHNNIVYSGNSSHRATNNSGNNNTWSHNLYFNGSVAVMGVGGLVADPLFVDKDAGDFRLQATSPAINSGNPALAPDRDIEGKPRPVHGAFDRGAFEYDGEFVPAPDPGPGPEPSAALSKTGWTASAFRTLGNNVPALAIDGDLNTAWHLGGSALVNRWYMIDMQSVKVVDKITLQSNTSNNFPYGYTIYVSEDPFPYQPENLFIPGNHTPTASVTNSGSLVEIPFTPATGRYIWIVVSVANADWWVLHEVNVYGKENPGISEPETDPVDQIVNGEFDDGLTGWWTSVTTRQNAKGKVTNDAEMSGENAFKFSIANNATSTPQQIQLGTENYINLDRSKTYTLAFQAKAANKRSIHVALQKAEAPGTEYFALTIDLTNKTQTFTQTFTPSASDPNARLVFNLGGHKHNVYIDSVTLIEVRPENMVRNGEFNEELTHWDTWNGNGAIGSAAVISDGTMSGANSFRYTIETGGTADWHVQLSQPSIPIEAGKPYTLRFLARAASDKSINVALEQQGGAWARYAVQNVQLTTANQWYTFTLTPNASDPAANLKFFLGGSSADVWIDAISLVECTSCAPAVSPAALRKGAGEETARESELTRDVVVYPNPARDQITVDFYHEKAGEIVLQIVEPTGRQVENQVRNSERGPVRMNVGVQDLKPGVYLLLIRTETKREIKRFVKAN